MTAQQCTPLGFVAVTVPATGSGVGLRLSRIVGSRFIICIPSNDFGNERKLAAHVIGTMKRRETTANDYWTVQAIFAFALHYQRPI
jgi:hypothetical protein